MKVAKLLTDAPESLGEGLARVKRRFKVVGQNLSSECGKRLYATAKNNRVEIRTTENKLLIEKTLSPLANIKKYIGKIAGIRKFYINEKISEGTEVRFARTIITDTFSKYGKPREIDNTLKLYPEYKDIIEKTQEKPAAKIYSKWQFNNKTIPYSKAQSMGFEI